MRPAVHTLSAHLHRGGSCSMNQPKPCAIAYSELVLPAQAGRSPCLLVTIPLLKPAHAVCRAATGSKNTSRSNSQRSSQSTSQSPRPPANLAKNPAPSKEQKLLPSPETSTVHHTAENGSFEMSAVCPICLQTELHLGQTGTPTYK